MDKKNVQKRKAKILLNPLFLQHFEEKYRKNCENLYTNHTIYAVKIIADISFCHLFLDSPICTLIQYEYRRTFREHSAILVGGRYGARIRCVTVGCTVGTVCSSEDKITTNNTFFSL